MFKHRSIATLVEAGHLYKAGRLDEADALARQTLKRNRSNSDALRLLGLIAVRKGDYEQALRHYSEARRIDPRNPQYPYLIAKALTVAGRLDEAVAWYDHAAAAKPGDRLVHAWKAAALERAGRLDEALDVVAPFIDRGGEDELMAEVAARIAQQRGRHEDAIDLCDRHLARRDLPAVARHVLAFLKAHSLDRLDRLDEAMLAYEEANAVLAVPFDPDEYARGIDEIVDTFSSEALRTMAEASSTDDRHVFIAGFPRSGTTLVERIIAAHPRGAGVGELEFFRELALKPGDGIEPYPRGMARLKAGSLTMAAAAYQERIPKAARSASRVCNKSLDNWRVLGLISRVLPASRVIWCRRNALDTCVSCYTRELMPGAMPFATDLAALGHVYRQHERLMLHWADTLDVPILEVRYEDVVADLDRQVARMLDFLGLPEDDRCLNFHEAADPATSLSYDQVRKPIYSSSTGRWQRYEAYLEPLIDALMGGGAGKSATGKR
ncbi:MAG: sulfotransferase [Phycisphaeraceae bacterium]|nr:sulfotransferase [Phycisphaeraceae bacterium]